MNGWCCADRAAGFVETLEHRELGHPQEALLSDTWWGPAEIRAQLTEHRAGLAPLVCDDEKQVACLCPHRLYERSPGRVVEEPVERRCKLHLGYKSTDLEPRQALGTEGNGALDECVELDCARTRHRPEP